MKFKSFRLIATIAIVTTLSAFAAPPAALKWDLEHKQVALKAGEVDAKFEFTATNTTKDEISISGLKPSCGCTTAQLPVTPFKLAPGSNVTISVSMSLAGKQGQITKTVTVESSAGSQVLLISATAPTETKTETK